MVRTRFAPSPTGYLHIGGVRTALFNWLFSRSRGGCFVLRVDDTDRERNLDETLAPILDGFRWLGIDWDEGPEVGGDYGPYYQSQRGELYQAAVDRLLASGHAYHDYASSEDLAEERKQAEADNRKFIYSRRFRAEAEADRERFESEGRQAVVRLEMPRAGECRFTDLIRGDMAFEWKREQDHVIQRADGSCLYHLASVVDDHEMAISHVIRAEEHLSNTPRQIFIAESLGYELPEYAHLPYVAEPGSKNKLSKRKLAKYLKHPEFARLTEHGEEIARTIGLSPDAETFNPVIVDFYETIGFLPEALLNYLVLLGWSLDDKTEHFDRAAMIESFSLERVQKSPASFDPIKLMTFEGRHMEELSIGERFELCRPFAERAGWALDTAEAADLRAIVAAAGDRIKVAGDVLQFEDFYRADDELDYDESAWNKRLAGPENAAGLLADFRRELAAMDAFDERHLEQVMRDFVESKSIKLGEIIHAVRVAATGKAVGFGMFETLAILGRGRTLARIDRALAQLAQLAQLARLDRTGPTGEE
ncbi:MAG: glutamate--tRNA ligase [bacterium]|nr:glutamate--tRNA ligase [bacterium]